jgi:hypothetical protein
MKRRFNAGLTPVGALCFGILILTVILSIIGIYSMVKGNILWFDTVYQFDTAYIRMPDDTIIAGNVESWLDFDNSDQVQVTIDGATYLTHASNVVLVSKK